MRECDAQKIPAIADFIILSGTKFVYCPMCADPKKSRVLWPDDVRLHLESFHNLDVWGMAKWQNINRDTRDAFTCPWPRCKEVIPLRSNPRDTFNHVTGHLDEHFKIPPNFGHNKHFVTYPEAQSEYSIVEPYTGPSLRTVTGNHVGASC